jgi:two-component system OmpR family response regulator
VASERVSVFSSENRAEVPVYPLDVFAVTPAGEEEIHRGSTQLPPEALELLVMLDGKKSVGDVEGSMPHLPPEKLRDVLRSLLAAKLVRAPSLDELSDIGVDFDSFFKAAAGEEKSSPGTQASADREAASGAPQLERTGYYVSIARKALKRRTAPAGAKLIALVIEDDPDVATLVKRLLDGAGFAASSCGARADTLARLRQTPMPDVIVLDVQLPDLNGFDLLAKLKTHPHLRVIPVVMLTADAKRESVMRGLATGADGYITKPFDHAALVRGVNAVLGN